MKSKVLFVFLMIFFAVGISIVFASAFPWHENSESGRDDTYAANVDIAPMCSADIFLEYILASPFRAKPGMLLIIASSGFDFLAYHLGFDLDEDAFAHIPCPTEKFAEYLAALPAPYKYFSFENNASRHVAWRAERTEFLYEMEHSGLLDYVLRWEYYHMRMMRMQFGIDDYCPATFYALEENIRNFVFPGTGDGAAGAVPVAQTQAN